jgi:CrcB protein
MTVWAWLGVAAVGGVGAVLRFLVDGAVSRAVSGRIPLGTLAVNLTGSVVLGVLTVSLSGTALLIAGTATIGSYTTFSTWMLETHRLGEDGEARNGALNLSVSLALGIGAAALGRWLAHAL